ncbi:MAG: hypothetical protein WC384_14115 [Prolixibacteraceae bacterium]|jgi:hypothetical protein
MKKQFFSLVMMLALVIVAGSAFGQDKFAPYPGGTYTYNLPYTLNHNGNVALTLTGGDMTLGTTTPSGLDETGTTVALSAGTSSIAIPITFANTATGTKTISIVITDLTSLCSNNIHLDVTMHALPALALGISSTTLTCQALVSTPASNVAASVPAGAETLINTITFTVVPTVTNITDYSYGYTLTIPTDGQTNLSSYSLAYSGPGTYTEGTGSVTVTGIDESTNANGVFTITFVTTTGIAPETITGTLSNATMADPVNSGTYTATLSPSTSNSTVNSVPTIGTFN